jgi:hypothetical protein
MPLANSHLARLFTQTMLVFIFSILGTYSVEKIGYKGYFNLLFLFAFIALISYILNRSPLMRIYMFIALCGFSFLTLGLTGHVLGYAD